MIKQHDPIQSYIYPSTREGFALWLAAMDEALEAFLSALPDKLTADLDFTPASLDKLERWLHALGWTAERLAKNRALLDGLSRYVGETFRAALGGEWTIQLDDARRAFAGRPILTGFANYLAPICPQALVLSAVQEKPETSLSAFFRFRSRYGSAPTASPAEKSRRYCRICNG